MDAHLSPVDLTNTEGPLHRIRSGAFLEGQVVLLIIGLIRAGIKRLAGASLAEGFDFVVELKPQGRFEIIHDEPGLFLADVGRFPAKTPDEIDHASHPADETLDFAGEFQGIKELGDELFLARRRIRGADVTGDELFRDPVEKLFELVGQPDSAVFLEPAEFFFEVVPPLIENGLLVFFEDFWDPVVHCLENDLGKSPLQTNSGKQVFSFLRIPYNARRRSQSKTRHRPGNRAATLTDFDRSACLPLTI